MIRIRTGCMLAVLGLFALSARAEDAAPAPRVLLLPAHSHGVDPAAARFVDRGLHNSAEQHGYVLVPDVADESATAVPAGTPNTPLTLVELWQRVHQRGADYAVQTIVSAERGKYVVELQVAVRDGRGPFFARTEANNAELETEAGKLLVVAIGGGTGDGTGIRSSESGKGKGTSGDGSESVNVPLPVPLPLPAHNPSPNPNPPPLTHRLRLALHDELVLGMSRDHFAGALLGARADYRLGRALYLGAYAGYANLPGSDGRAHALLGYAQLEDRVQVSERFGVPLRLGLGYLSRNGSVLRLSSGVAFRIVGRLELVLDLLSPMFWVTPDTTLFSLNLGLELNLAL